MYVCVCIYIYIYIYIYIHTHAHTHAHARAHARINIYVYTHTLMHAYTRAHTGARGRASMRGCASSHASGLRYSSAVGKMSAEQTALLLGKLNGGRDLLQLKTLLSALQRCAHTGVHCADVHLFETLQGSLPCRASGFSRSSPELYPPYFRMKGVSAIAKYQCCTNKTYYVSTDPKDNYSKNGKERPHMIAGRSSTLVASASEFTERNSKRGSRIPESRLVLNSNCNLTVKSPRVRAHFSRLTF